MGCSGLRESRCEYAPLRPSDYSPTEPYNRSTFRTENFLIKRVLASTVMDMTYLQRKALRRLGRGQSITIAQAKDPLIQRCYVSGYGTQPQISRYGKSLFEALEGGMKTNLEVLFLEHFAVADYPDLPAEDCACGNQKYGQSFQEHLAELVVLEIME